MINMKIRIKTFIAIFSTMTILGSMVGVGLFFLKQHNLSEIEIAINQNNLLVAQSILKGKEQNLLAITEIFGHNDHLWQFTKGNKQLTSDIKSLHLEFIAIYDKNQIPIYTHTAKNVPESAAQIITKIEQYYPQLLINSSFNDHKHSGFILLNNQPLLVALCPIVGSRNSKSSGIIIVAQFLNQQFWQKNNSKLNIHAAIYPNSATSSAVNNNAPATSARIILSDIAGNRNLVLANAHPPTMERIIHRSFLVFIAFICFVCLLIIFLTHYVMEHLVLSRLRNLDSRLQRVGGVGGDQRLTIISDDEIGSIAISVNNMLERLQIKDQRLQLTNKVFATTSEAIIVTDSYNDIIEVNQAFVDSSGYSRSELIGKNPRMVKSQHHTDDFYKQMWHQIVSTGHWKGEIWDAHKDGTEYPKWLIIDTLKDEMGEITNYIGFSIDLTRIHEAEQRLHHLAYFDHLTGLPNRVSFCRTLDMHLQQLNLHIEQNSLAVLILNINSFKQVIEVHGPDQADQLLQMVTQRLRHCLLEDVYLARIGDDEFALIIKSEQCQQQIQQFLDSMQAPFSLALQHITLSLNIGIALAPEHGCTVAELIKNADIAMYSLKDTNKTCHQYFQPLMNSLLIERMELAEMLRYALAKKEFELYYQPKISLHDGKIVGAEALLRWHSPIGMIPPDKFIPIAEETGLIIPIGEWVLREACQQVSEWRSNNSNLHIGVNVSPLQFELESFPQLVADVIEQYSLPAGVLELEITEEMIIADIEKTIITLHRLHDLGIELSMDDFGTGYSSLSYLIRLPLDILKIDRSFMQGVPGSKDSTNVVLAILSLALSLGLKVTAEGGETKEHMNFLQNNGCDYFQGYFCSKPLTAADFVNFMQLNNGFFPLPDRCIK